MRTFVISDDVASYETILVPGMRHCSSSVCLTMSASMYDWWRCVVIALSSATAAERILIWLDDDAVCL